MDNFQIRLAKPIDLRSICKLNIDMTETIFSKKIERQEILVLEIDSVICGYLTWFILWDTCGFLHGLIIREDLQRKNWGTTLLKYWENFTRKDNSWHPLFSTDCSKKDIMRPFLEKNGYHQAGSIELHENVCPELIYKKQFDKK